MTEPDQLTALLSAWAAQQRMTSGEVSVLRARILASASAEAAEAPDADWLWSLLKPVTRLLDRLGDPPADRDPATRWLPSAAEAPQWTTYLQLAPAS
jgi:hypothetical protein